MKKRITSVLLVLALCLTLLPTAALAADGEHTAGNHDTSKFTKLWVRKNDDDTSTLMKGDSEWTITKVDNDRYNCLMLDNSNGGSYYLGTDLTLKGGCSILISGNVTLCLNGKNIVCEENTNDRHVISVGAYGYENAHLTLTDCQTTAGTIDGGGKASPVVNLYGGSDLDMYGGTITGSSKGVEFTSEDTVFNMYGGKITGNSSYGVYMTAGTFTMEGGFISNNPGRGVEVAAISKFNMRGGEITDNKGGGVEVSSSDSTPLTVSGKAKITGNTVDGKKNNVYLPQGKFFIADKLTDGTDGAKIGVTTEKIPSSESTVKIASAFNSNCIESDMDGYKVQFDESSSYAVLAVDPAAHAKTCTSHSSLDKGTKFIPWTDAEATWQNGRGKTASNSLPSKTGSYYLTGPVTLEAEWKPASGTTVLCLNGQTVTGVDGQMTITVTSDRTFVLTDCQSEGKLVNRSATTDDSRGVSVSGGSFTMYNGTVTGFADGVRVSSGATFAMYGGSVVNSRDFGVHNGGTFEMYGGNITGNGSGAGSSLTGCGVFDNGTMTVGGKATVQNNTNGSNGPCNVCLAKYDNNNKLVPITVNNDFAGSFGVATRPQSGPYKDFPYQVTIGGGTIEDILAKITPDNAEKYEIVAKEGNLWLQVVKREPTKIAAPQAVSGLIYNGTTQTGVLTGEGYELTDNTATDAGSYTARATLEDGYAWSDGDTSNTKEISWSIAKKTPEISDFVMNKPTSLVYDGREKPATVTLSGNLTGCDFVVEYHSDSYLQEKGDLPKNVGHYTFWVKVNESSKNFTASQSDILDTNWGFDILKANLTGITATGFNGGYDGNEHTITVTGAPEGTTIRYNSVDTPAIGYDSKYWGSSSLGYTNVGNHTVYYRVYGDNYNTFGGSAAINITKAFPEAPTGLRGTQGQKLSTVKLPDGWAWDAPNTEMGTLGEQTFKASYTDTTGNYENGSNVDVTVTVSNKTEAGVAIPVPAAKTYGDKEFTVTASVAAPGEHEKWINWRSSDPKVLEISNIDGGTVTVKVVGAGTAKLEVIYESDTTYGTAESNEITVSPATVTVTAKPQNIYVGGTAPDLSSPKAETHYTVTGLVGDDALVGTVTLKYQKDGVEVKPDTSKAGTYDIVISGVSEPAGGNYKTIKLENGKLTISNRPSSGGGGGGGGASVPTYPVSSSNASASAAVGGSVSISTKNASAGDTVTVTVSPETGYRLEKLTVVDKNGKEIPVTLKDGKYTFTMPASQVDIKPVFEKIPAETAEPTFPDVPSSAYYAEPVKWAAEKGITSGTKDGGFAPGNTCTRAQIVTFLWRAAGSPEPQTAETGMTDVSPAAYYAKAVAWAIENGITVGRSDGSFNPNGTCTRANGVTFLYRAAKAAASGNDAGFSDVTADAYYAAAVQWALENGITNGQSNGLFGPDGACTRAQIVTFLYRLYVKA